jgi:hypothetical protein
VFQFRFSISFDNFRAAGEILLLASPSAPVVIKVVNVDRNNKTYLIVQTLRLAFFDTKCRCLDARSIVRMNTVILDCFMSSNSHMCSFLLYYAMKFDAPDRLRAATFIV